MPAYLHVPQAICRAIPENTWPGGQGAAAAVADRDGGGRAAGRGAAGHAPAGAAAS